ncbi:hypothetical protein HHL08_22425 [Sphingobium sp. AR-3-1]|uniref:Polysaccharide biosynthesis protein n=1 Tax=Sphingobium psychrophilum TaxID=2728834 RepID=A0A7X9WZN5_9SPHN|nr:hypothetical protein [Sphingobium psychrophilum]NML12854.1 hypothetical protein [Sphingobium psychrophilum]
MTLIQRVKTGFDAGKKGYGGLLLLGTGTRLFALGSQFVVLIVMTRMLDKSSFGDAMGVFAFYRIASVGIGTGLGNVLLYHISRTPTDHKAEIRRHRTVALTGILLATAVAGGCAFWADSLAIEIFGKPSLARWLMAFAPFMVFSTLNTVAIGALDGRSKIMEALIVAEAAPNGLRLLLLPLVHLLSLPDTAVAHVMTLSVAIPWLRTAWRLGCRSVGGLAPWVRWDAGYATKYVLFSFSSLQLGGVDILIVSGLFSSLAAADYAVAARIAALYPFFQFIILRRFTPIAGQLLHVGNMEVLQAEVTRCRRASLLAVSLTMAGIVMVLPFGLRLLGDYESAVPIAIMLTVAPFVRSNFASCDRILQIAGYANWGLGIMITGLAVVICVPLMLHARLGLESIPIGMAASSLLLQPVIAHVLKQRLGISTIGLSEIGMIVFVIAAVMLAHQFSQAYVSAAIVTGAYLVIAALAAKDYSGFTKIVSAFRPRLPGQDRVRK